MLIGRPIYLHFLDRELNKACGSPLNSDNVLRALNCAVYGTVSALYVGYSLLWESEALSQPLRQYVQALSSLGIISTLSSYSTVNEFLDSRRSMYDHVAHEYPMYFIEEPSLLIPYNPSIRKETHTTVELSRYLEDIGNLTSVSNIVNVNAETLLELNRPINNSIRQREDKAITYNLFSNIANGDIFIRHEYAMRRIISYAYTQYYLGLYPNSTILYGIGGLQAFDYLSNDYFLYHTPQLSMLLSYLALAPSDHLARLHPEECAFYASYIRRNPLFNDICDYINTLLAAIHLYGVGTVKPFVLNYESLDRLANPYKRNKCITKIKNLNDIQGCLGKAYTLASQLVKRAARDNQLGNFIIQATQSLDNSICDIVLLAVNKIEIGSICREAKKLSSTTVTNIADNGYVDLGVIGDCRLVLVACRAGSNVDGGSYSVVSEVIKMYRPHVLICLGIAMGLDSKKDNLGDVVISSMIVDVDYKRVGYNDEEMRNINISRGERVNADNMMVKAFLEHSYNYNEFKSIAKPILTGSALVDNPDAARELHMIELEARAYEMEGYGVYRACKETNTPWIVVKGISDWGDGRKKGDNEEERQTLAANNAAKLVLGSIRNGMIQVRTITGYTQRILPIIS